jgi:hypothetical protein
MALPLGGVSTLLAQYSGTATGVIATIEGARLPVHRIVSGSALDVVEPDADPRLGVL